MLFMRWYGRSSTHTVLLAKWVKEKPTAPRLASYIIEYAEGVDNKQLIGLCSMQSVYSENLIAFVFTTTNKTKFLQTALDWFTGVWFMITPFPPINGKCQ